MSTKNHSKYQTRVKYLEQYNPDFTTRRKYFLLTCVLRGLIMGLQYGVQVPSAWAYLQIFHAPTGFYGFLISADKIAATFASPVLGRVYDNNKRLRCIIVAVNIIDVIGSVLYALPFSIWLLLMGRVLSGIGMAFSTATNSEIAWITQEKNRSTVFARVLISYVCGITLGPPFAALFQHIELNISHWHIDYRNLPGLISALLWLVMLPISWCLVNDLARNFVDVESENFESQELCENVVENNEESSQAEIAAQKYDDEIFTRVKDDAPGSGQNGQEKQYFPQFKEVLNEILSPELLVLFASNTFAYIYLYSGETAIPLFTQRDFGWAVVYTSLVYVVTSAENVVVYAVFGVIGTKVSDSILITGGLSCMTVSSAIFLFYQYTRGELKVSVPIFCVSVATGTPFFALYEIGGRALLTKVIPMHCQGSIQGAYDSAISMSGILGPIWGVFGYSHVYIATSISLALISGCLIVFLCSQKRLQLRIQRYSKG